MATFDPSSRNYTPPESDTKEQKGDFFKLPPEVQDKIMKLAGKDGVNLASSSRDLHKLGSQEGAIVTEKLRYILNNDTPLAQKITELSQILNSKQSVRGVNFGLEDNHALRLAAASPNSNDNKLLEMLLSSTSVDPASHDFEALTLCCKNNNIDGVKKLLEKLDLSTNLIPIANAIIKGGNVEALLIVLTKNLKEEDLKNFTSKNLQDFSSDKLQNLSSEDILVLLKTAIEHSQRELATLLLSDKRLGEFTPQLYYDAYAHGLKEVSEAIYQNGDLENSINDSDKFVAAACGGYVEDVRTMLTTDPLPISVEAYIGALILASSSGNQEMVNLLLEHFEGLVPEENRKEVINACAKAAFLSDDKNVVEGTLGDKLTNYISEEEGSKFLNEIAEENFEHGRYNIIDAYELGREKSIKNPTKYSILFTSLPEKTLSEFIGNPNDIKPFKDLLRIINSGPRIDQAILPEEENRQNQSKPSVTQYDTFLIKIYNILFSMVSENPEINKIIDDIQKKIEERGIKVGDMWGRIFSQPEKLEKLLSSTRNININEVVNRAITWNDPSIIDRLINDRRFDIEKYEIPDPLYGSLSSSRPIFKTVLTEKIDIIKYIKTKNESVSFIYEKTKEKDIWKSKRSEIIDILTEYIFYPNYSQVGIHHESLRYMFKTVLTTDEEKKYLLDQICKSAILNDTDRDLHLVKELGGNFIDQDKEFLQNQLKDALEKNSYKPVYSLVYFFNVFSKEELEQVLDQLPRDNFPHLIGLGNFLSNHELVSQEAKDRFRAR